MSIAAEDRPRYTIDDYQHWEGRWELWEGYPVAMAPSPFGPHAAVVSELIRLIGNQLSDQPCDAVVLSEIDWIVDRTTVVRPDVVVLCGGVPERHVESPPAMVIEVTSPSTAENDRGYKRQLYASQGVAMYVLIDRENGHIVIQRSDGRAETMTDRRVSSTVCGDCHLELDAATLLAF